MYQKYIIKKGKKIGPYFYNSVRMDNGKIKTIYIGKNPPEVDAKPVMEIKPHTETPLGGHHNLYLLALLFFVLLGFFLFRQGDATQDEGSYAKTIFHSAGKNLLTGFVVSDANLDNETSQTQTESVIIKEINLIIDESSLYQLAVLGEHELVSLKVSGSVIGDGAASVYVENKNTVLYTNQQKKERKGSLLTGFAIVSGNTQFIIVDEGGKEIKTTISSDNTTNMTTATFDNKNIETMTLKDLSGTPLVYDELDVKCVNCNKKRQFKIQLFV